jgi:hypothetical protein
VRGVDCLCATEPPFSSDNQLGNVGAASLAQALAKNTTLQRLSLSSEFVVVGFCFGRGIDCGLCCCELFLVFVLGLRGPGRV